MPSCENGNQHVFEAKSVIYLIRDQLYMISILPYLKIQANLLLTPHLSNAGDIKRSFVALQAWKQALLTVD